jgi:cation transport regulator ChaC
VSAAHYYFAYGSNMNMARVAARGLDTVSAVGAILPGVRLAFNKSSPAHAGEGHANICFDRDASVEGVLYRLATVTEIDKMDRYETTPFSYSRDLVTVRCGDAICWAWTYFANPAVIAEGLRPSREYLNHLLAGHRFLSAAYYERLAAWPCHD